MLGDGYCSDCGYSESETHCSLSTMARIARVKKEEGKNRMNSNAAPFVWITALAMMFKTMAAAVAMTAASCGDLANGIDKKMDQLASDSLARKSTRSISIVFALDDPFHSASHPVNKLSAMIMPTFV